VTLPTGPASLCPTVVRRRTLPTALRRATRHTVIRPIVQGLRRTGPLRPVGRGAGGAWLFASS